MLDTSEPFYTKKVKVTISLKGWWETTGCRWMPWLELSRQAAAFYLEARPSRSTNKFQWIKIKQEKFVQVSRKESFLPSQIDYRPPDSGTNLSNISWTTQSQWIKDKPNNQNEIQYIYRCTSFSYRDLKHPTRRQNFYDTLEQKFRANLRPCHTIWYVYWNRNRKLATGQGWAIKR